MPATEKPWNPKPRVGVFLAVYGILGDITRAAKAAKINRSAHYRLIESSSQYAKAFHAAGQELGDKLVALAVERVQIGVKRLVMYHGKPVMVARDPSKRVDERKNPKVPHYEYEVSEGLHMSLLKALKPELFRERVSAEVTGKNGGPIDSRLEIVFVRAQPDPDES
jgi:hypothetical protein